jgi:hypothetical protein
MMLIITLLVNTMIMQTKISIDAIISAKIDIIAEKEQTTDPIISTKIRTTK